MKALNNQVEEDLLFPGFKESLEKGGNASKLTSLGVSPFEETEEKYVVPTASISYDMPSYSMPSYSTPSYDMDVE